MSRVFHDHGRREDEFLREFLVRCPQCDKQAIVRSDGIPWTVNRATLTCASCGHNKTWSGRAPGAAVKTAPRRCPKCARWFERRITGSPNPRIVHLHCATCGLVVREPVSWMRIPGALTLDPYFGCKLWLIGDVKGDVFWAYNRAHLSFIRDYVAATVRVRKPHANGSLASRLPAFLLAKKNRSAVLKEIDRMTQV